MRSKVLLFGLGLAGFFALIFGVIKFTESRKFVTDYEEVGKLLTEAQSKGFMTDGASFAKNLPDDQNAWIEIGPIITPTIDPKAPRGAYQNRNTIALNSYALPSDLPLFEAAYAFKKADLITIISALKRKGHLQIPRNYNKGYLMEYPEMDALKVLANDIALLALAKTYRRDLVGALDTLRADYVLVASLMDLNETIPRQYAMEIFLRVISKVEMRIIEFAPSTIEPVKKQFGEWAPKLDRDPFDAFKWVFLKDLAICRNFDNPIMDKPHIGYPLENLSNYPKGKAIDQYFKLQPGTHIPTSPAMRKCMVNLLHRWRSAIDFINDPKTKRTIQTSDEVTKLVAWERDCPKPLAERWQEFYIGNSDTEQFRNISNLDLKREMFRQLKFHQSNGKWSTKLLGTIREFDSSVKYTITPLKGGIQIGGGSLNSDGQFVYRFCYPHSIGLPVNNAYLETIAKLRKTGHPAKP